MVVWCFYGDGCYVVVMVWCGCLMVAIRWCGGGHSVEVVFCKN